MARLVVMTSNHLRHKFFVNTLAARHEVAGVFCEAKRPLPAGGQGERHPVVQRHFSERTQAEQRYFGGHQELRIGSGSVHALAYGQANAPETFEAVRALAPEFIVLFGTSIIRDPLLSHYQGRIINLHLGLSPYYRGSGTNFWPLVNREPQCVGATIHHAILKVDAGDVLAQVRPRPEAADRCHELGCKAIAAGAEIMAAVLERLEDGGLTASPQEPGGRLYRGKDFHVEAVERMWRHFDTGMMEEYLAHKRDWDARFPLVELA